MRPEKIPIDPDQRIIGCVVGFHVCTSGPLLEKIVLLFTFQMKFRVVETCNQCVYFLMVAGRYDSRLTVLLSSWQILYNLRSNPSG